VLTLQLLCLQWLSEERDKHVWEERYSHPWDEIIGRMYLLKAHNSVFDKDYGTALADFEQALVFFAKDGVDQVYYARALADKALVQCLLAQYQAALATIDQAIAVSDPSHQFDQMTMLNNRGAILVLVGAFPNALNMLSTQLDKDPKDEDLLFTLATCLLHLERYHEAVVAYEQVITKDSHRGEDQGLVAARLGQQPNWTDLPTHNL